MFIGIRKLRLYYFTLKVSFFISMFGLLNLERAFKEKRFFLCVLIISFIVFLWSFFYIEGTANIVIFLCSLLAFVVSILLLILSNRFFLLFLGWEGLGLTSFLLIVFYQNWVSFKGGLLTILTNRLGDIVLLLSLSYWVLKLPFLRLFKRLRIYFLFFLLFLSSTKSAQFPFFRWLPAAIAAPTPVRALVHSSTLVTAGIWIILRFNNLRGANRRLIYLMGIITLILASIAAIVELDAKKLVALSTLRQLGLMVFSLFSFREIVTLFHLIAHAFAKARLFLIIGSLIHRQFSFQDTRKLRLNKQERVSTLIIIISVARLRGLTFYSGFYSKDFIISTFIRVNNSLIRITLNFLIVRLTLIYCIKLLKRLLMLRSKKLSFMVERRVKLLPRVILRFVSTIFGFFFIKNFFLLNLIKFNLTLLWLFLLFRGLVFYLLEKDFLKNMFSIQDYLIVLLNKLVFLIAKKINFFFLVSEKVILETFSSLRAIIFRRIILILSVYFLLALFL